jgi:hypothetical protein
MSLMEILILIVLAVVMFAVPIALAIYRLAHIDICFTMVPQGEIIVVMKADKVKRYIGNIIDHWVNPETGEVTKGSAPASLKMPREIWGIYWLGFWPFASRYTYKFPRAKYIKEPGKSVNYVIVGKEDKADSVFWQASYGIEVKMAETIEGVPITAQLVITTETVHVGIALFANKSPGWLERVTAAVKAQSRDFIGNEKLADINKMKVETGDADGKSKLQQEIDLLNESIRGNPGLIETTGQKIKAVNFLGYDIEKIGLNKAQEASIAQYYADRDADKVRTEARVEAEKTVIVADAELKASERKAQQIELLGKAEATAIRAKGTAEAETTKLMSDAVSGNQHAGTMALANAIKVQPHLNTLILGHSVMPTVSTEAPAGAPKKEERKEGDKK